MEFDDKNNSPKKGSNYSRNSAEFPPNITIKKEQPENNSHRRTDDQFFYGEDDMSYIMSYMIHDLTDQHALQICGNLGIDTLQHLGELEQEDIMEKFPNKRWAQSVDNMRKYFLNTVYLHSNMNKVREKARNLNGENNLKNQESEDDNEFKYTPKIKETQLKIFPAYHEGVKEWIKWKILCYNNMGFNHVKGIIRSVTPPSPDNFKAIQI